MTSKTAAAPVTSALPKALSPGEGTETSLPDIFFRYLREQGAGDVSWCRPDDGPAGLSFAVSVAVRLSDAVIDEIDNEPTYTYFHHYRTVNAFLDQLTLRAGLWLQNQGARYLAVAASQSAPGTASSPATPFAGRYSHKKAACLGGMGAIGRSNLFLHEAWGPRVRLATVFTDWREFEKLSALNPAGSGNTATRRGERARPVLSRRCADCGLCASACPAGAIGLSADCPVFDPEACSSWMKKAYQHIGRGAVCGICVRVCPCGIMRT